jgi:hypothetical protein
VFLTSSAAGEDSQESDELRGSFFTHHLASGLRGAADEDGDGHVTLAEAYAHAYHATLRTTAATVAGVQHPTFRYELKGGGDVILTSPLGGPAATRATLRFPAGAGWLVLAGSSGGRVVAEIAAADQRRRVALRPGRYFVRGRGADHLLEGTVEGVAGGEVDVGGARLSRVAYARLVRKGGGPERSLGVEGGALVRTPLLPEQGACLGGFAGGVMDLPALTLRARLSICRAGFAGRHVDAASDQLALALHAAHVWDMGRVSFEVGAHGGAALLRQSFETRGTAPDRATAAVQAGGGGGVSLDAGRGLSLLLEAAAEAWGFRRASEDGDRFSVSFAARVGLGAALRF